MILILQELILKPPQKSDQLYINVCLRFLYTFVFNSMNKVDLCSFPSIQCYTKLDVIYDFLEYLLIK